MPAGIWLQGCKDMCKRGKIQIFQQVSVNHYTYVCRVLSCQPSTSCCFWLRLIFTFHVLHSSTFRIKKHFMKHFSNFLKAIVVASLACVAGLAFADTTQLNVLAKVSGVCKFGAAPTMDFGLIDPSTVTADISGTASVQYRCTKGTVPATLSLPTGTFAMVDPSVATSTLPFTLTLPATSTLLGTGFGAAPQLTFSVTGKILLADAQAALAGTGYTQKLTLTITP